MNFKKLFLFAVISGSLLLSCSKKSSNDEDTADDSDVVSNIAMQALSESSSNASSTEGGSVGASMISDQIEIMSNELQELNSSQGYISPYDRLHQNATACSYANRTCSGATGTIDWNSCTVSISSTLYTTLTGGWTETWSTPSDCTSSRLTQSATVTRSSTGATVTFPRGRKIVTDTSGGTTYEGTSIPSGSIITERTGTSTRTISMTPTNAAIHQVGTGRLGTKLFDYFVRPSITVTGAKNASSIGMTGSRSMTGTVTIIHNLAKYTATNTFNTVTWGSTSCCYPTSGSITATYSGTNKPADSSTLTFDSTCQTATFEVVSGSSTTSSKVDLENCQ